jgi:uncharacterized protein DUF2809
MSAQRWLEGLMDRRRHLALLAVVTPLGFATKFYSGPAAGWISTEVGGFLYVVFWVFVVLAASPALSSRGVAIGVFLATSAVEFLQLWHPVPLERVRATFLGHAVLGSTFAWSDFAYYAFGAWAAYLIAQRLRWSTGSGPDTPIPARDP